VLDQAEEIGPGGGQRAASVILGEPFQLPEHRLAHVAQVTVQVLFREIIDHGKRACHPAPFGIDPGCGGPSSNAAVARVASTSMINGSPASML
jgi:hypothetical protein